MARTHYWLVQIFNTVAFLSCNTFAYPYVGTTAPSNHLLVRPRLECPAELKPKVTSVLNTFFYPELAERGLFHLVQHLTFHVHMASDTRTQFAINETHLQVVAMTPRDLNQQPHDLLRVLGRVLLELSGRTSIGEWLIAGSAVVLPAAQQEGFTTRSHQLGFYFEGRTPQFEAYVRELAVFGANQVEFAHWDWNPRSTEHCNGGNVSALIEWSGILDDMGLNMSLWWPVDVYAYDNGSSMEAVVAKLKRLDSLFVPGGDGGIVLSPKEFFPAAEKMATLVRKHHPHASVWMSAQEYSRKNVSDFMALASDTSVSGFLTGLAYGPHVSVPLVEFDRMAPLGMPVRQYPDLCHSSSAQYEVYQWDPRLAVTHGRLVVNPMPEFFYRIAKLRRNGSFASHQAGFGAYSEGISDDLNKAIWSSYYLDPTLTMEEIVKLYARYYTTNGLHPSQSAALVEQLIFALEKTFGGGMLEDNHMNVMNALSLATKLQETDPQAVDGNWRLQAFIYRARFDAYILMRVQHENQLLDEAMQILAVQGVTAQNQVVALLDTSLSGLSAAAKDLKNQTVHMADVLGNTLGSTAILQCQAPNLGVAALDSRISDVQFLLSLAKKDLLKDRPEVIAALLNYTSAGSDGYYDAAGSVREDDHKNLAGGQGALVDPSSYFTPIQAVATPKNESMPFSWFQHTKVFYENPLQFSYDGLDQHAAYAMTLVFHPNKYNQLRIVADGTVTLSEYFVPDEMPVTVAIPAAITNKGHMVLGFYQPPGLVKVGDGRFGLVADIWIHRVETVLGVNILAQHMGPSTVSESSVWV